MSPLGVLRSTIVAVAGAVEEYMLTSDERNSVHDQHQHRHHGTMARRTRECRTKASADKNESPSRLQSALISSHYRQSNTREPSDSRVPKKNESPRRAPCLERSLAISEGLPQAPWRFSFTCKTCHIQCPHPEVGCCLLIGTYHHLSRLATQTPSR